MIFTSAEELFSYLEEMEVEAVSFAGFDDALLGAADQGTETVLVYDYDLVLKILVEQGMTADGAKQWYEYNMMNDMANAPVVLDFTISSRSSPSQHPPNEAVPESPA